MRLLALSLSAVLLLPASLLAAPRSQYSAEDLENSFANPPAETSATKGFTLFAPPVQAGSKAVVGAKASSRHAARHVAGGAIEAAAPSRGKDLLITFGNNSSALTAQAMANAREFAKALNSPTLTAVRFAIEGHTNAVGGHDANVKLSKDRAGALVDFLVGLGVDRRRFDVTGFGFDHPLDGVSPAAASNRRVEARRLT